MLRRVSVVFAGLVVAGFLTSGAAAAAADRYDPEVSSSVPPGYTEVFPGLVADTLNGLVGGRTYSPTR